eukprot:scaffold115_cov304-Prasinococcus_capsulatus_cf.AAC.4
MRLALCSQDSCQREDRHDKPLAISQTLRVVRNHPPRNLHESALRPAPNAPSSFQTASDTSVTEASGMLSPVSCLTPARALRRGLRVT